LIAAVERPLIQWGGRGMGLLVPLRGRLCRMKVRRMAVSRPFGEPGALHALSNARSSASYARRRILGDVRKTHPLHRVPLKLAQHPTDQLLKRTERNADGGRSRPAVKVLDERFDVFAPDRVDSGRYPATEVRELFSRLRVGLDGSWCAPAARSDRCQVRNRGPVWVQTQRRTAASTEKAAYDSEGFGHAAPLGRDPVDLVLRCSGDMPLGTQRSS
jgi:hypothetical protein